jgi:ABC-2 type transport system permease protein
MLKTLLRIRFSAYATQVVNSGSRRKGSSAGKLAGFALLFAFILFSLGMLFYMTFLPLGKIYHAAGTDWVFFTFYALVAFVVMFVFSVFTSKSQLFEARDNEMLLALPLRPRTILASRLLLLILINFLMELAVAVPALLCGYFDGAMAVVSFVLLALALPLLSVALSSLFGWVIAKLSAHTRHKSLVSTVLALIFLMAYLYFYTSFMSNNMAALLDNADAIGNALSGFAPLLWLGKAMAQGDLLSLLLSLLVLLVPFAIACWILSITFIRTVTDKSHVSKVRYEEKTLAVSSAANALLRKEFARFGASSVYMLNAGLGLVFLLIGGVALVVERNMLLSLNLGSFFDFLPGLLAAAIALLLAMTTITAPSVSLEGQSLWIGQSLPVDPFTVIWAKARLQLVLSLPVCVFVSLCAIFVTGPDVLTAIFMVLYPAAFAVLMAVLGLVENLRHPNFTWINETQVVKQGMSLLITMLLGMVLSLALGALILYVSTKGLPLVGLVGATAICAVMDFLYYRWLRTRGGQIYSQLT